MKSALNGVTTRRQMVVSVGPTWVNQQTWSGPNPYPRLDQTNGLLLPKSGLQVSTLSKRGLALPEPLSTRLRPADVAG